MPTIRTDWIEWASQDENWLYLPAGNEPRGIADEEWMSECIRAGSMRKGDYTVQETLGGPWGTEARDCAIQHAMFGDDNSGSPYLWDGSCPVLVDGVADLVGAGTVGVTFSYGDDPSGFPGGADIAHMTVTTRAFGVWLIPLKLNLPPRGVLPIPDPEADGLTPEEAATADIEFESETVQLVGVQIADGTNEFTSDPEAYFAVNYDRQPSFIEGEWQAWQKGALPGSALTPTPGWVDGPEPYSITFPSEPVAWEDKAWHDLDVPADGFDSLTQDHVNDTYDYGVMAGAAEAFGQKAFTTSRSSSATVILKAFVQSPRYRWVYEGTATAPPRRILGRPHPARIFGDNTVQNGRRALGGIL